MLSPMHGSPRRLPIFFIAIATILAVLLSACGGASSTGTTNPSATIAPAKKDVNPPSDLLTSGTLLVGSDTTYAPMEYIDTQSGHAVGFDVDLVSAIAQHMGIKAVVKTTSFTTIFDDLNNRRFDIVASSVTINSARQAKFQFVPYFIAGESLLVQKGNPLHITSTADLCGKNVGVQTGTTEQTDLDTASKKCVSEGKGKINETILASQQAVVQLLANNRVVATYQDSPVSDYYNKLNPGQFEVGGSIVDAAPYGIMIRKGDTAMYNAVNAAFNAVRKDGTYDQLFQKWQFSSEAKPNFNS